MKRILRRATLLLVLSCTGSVLLASPVMACTPEYANRSEKPIKQSRSVGHTADTHQNIYTVKHEVNEVEEGTGSTVSSYETHHTEPDVPKRGEGNNGTLKVHEVGTPSSTENNDPKVCAFNLEGFGFDSGQSGYLKFSVQGKDTPTGVAPEAVYAFGPTNAHGYAVSRDFNGGSGTVKIVNGHYNVTLYGKDAGGSLNYADVKAKTKVFKIECAGTATPVNPPRGGNGGVVLAVQTTVSQPVKVVQPTHMSSLENTGNRMIVNTAMSLVLVAIAWAVLYRKTPGALPQETINRIAL